MTLSKHYQVLVLQLGMLRQSERGITASRSITVGGGTYVIFTRETEGGKTEELEV